MTALRPDRRPDASRGPRPAKPDHRFKEPAVKKSAQLLRAREMFSGGQARSPSPGRQVFARLGGLDRPCYQVALSTRRLIYVQRVPDSYAGAASLHVNSPSDTTPIVFHRCG